MASRFMYLQELVDATKSMLLPTQLLYHFQEETKTNCKVATKLYRLAIDLIKGMTKSDKLITELKSLSDRSVIIFKGVDYLKKYGNDEGEACQVVVRGRYVGLRQRCFIQFGIVKCNHKSS
ncbi:hypothetical protein Tco_1187232, partial [Tanacetum coccineum]